MLNQRKPQTFIPTKITVYMDAVPKHKSCRLQCSVDVVYYNSKAIE